jgi:hypothetical protein
MSSPTSVETLLSRIRNWWNRQNELRGLDPMELERVAKEIGMSARDLENLVARGPEAATQLYERMQALGLSRTEIEHSATDVLRDLQRTCACCNEKSRCERDLRKRPDDQIWNDYCPNAVTLDTLAKAKGRAGKLT